MPRIEWNDTFSVNVEEIDEQHRKWIDIINTLHDSLLGRKGLDEITLKSLKAMEEYGAFHFGYEEEYMARINYPDLPAHKKEHEEFLNKVRKYVEDEEAGKLVLNTEVMKMLMDWLQNHILRSDKRYSEGM